MGFGGLRIGPFLCPRAVFYVGHGEKENEGLKGSLFLFEGGFIVVVGEGVVEFERWDGCAGFLSGGVEWVVYISW